MLFDSLVFVGFAAVLLPASLLSSGRSRVGLLTLASYAFYGWWDPRFCGLLLLSTAVDYTMGRAIESRPARARWALSVSIVVNLGILAVFKYFDFFVDSFLAATGSLGLAPHVGATRVVLPIGISFYSFQTLAYTIDVYRGKLRAERDPLVFALFVAWFPQLVAGPIERARTLLPQLRARPVLTPASVRTGVGLLVMGWFKKVGLADGVAPYVDEVFADAGSYSSASLILATHLFAVQLYGDFSGYSDMARGISRLFGVELSLNFDRPYLANTIADLWRRWHITLSRWFLDYLYLPLGGSRAGTARNLLNLFIVFTVSGIWHGAGWNFLLWGWANVAIVLIYRAWTAVPGVGGAIVKPGSLRWFGGVLLTFEAFVATLLVFRSESLAGLWTSGHVLLQNPLWLGMERPFLLALLVYGLPMVLLDIVQFRTQDETPFTRWGRPAQGILLGVTIVWVLVAGGVDIEEPFLYFQF